MSSPHHRFAASAASRWTSCLGSHQLSQRVKDGDQSPAAARGTALHAAAEDLLTRSAADGHPLPLELPQEDLEMVMAYVSYVKGLPGVKLLEVGSTFVPECGGTADCACFHPDGLLEIVDFKSGYNPVDPEENLQLSIYALGLIRKFEAVLAPVERIRLTIVQPSRGAPKSWDLTRRKLERIGKRVAEAVSKIKAGDTTLTPSDSACRWCPAKAFCPALRDRALEVAKEDFAGLVRDAESGERELQLSGAEVSQRMELVPLLKAWIGAVEAEAKSRLLRGDSVPGFKVVEGRRSREWKDQVEAKAKLLLHLDEDELYGERPFVSPAQAEKLLGKAKGKEIVSSLVEPRPGAPTVVPESDKRPPMASKDLAFRDFADEVCTQVDE